MITELRAHLKADAGVTAIAGPRVEWAKVPQGMTMPAVILHAISAPPLYTMRGRVSLIGELVQIDCWASTFLVARNLAAAVTDALDQLTEPPLQAIIENQRSDLDTAEGRSDLYRASLDVRVWHSQAA